MGKKYLDTKEGSLEQSVLGVWQTAIDESDARVDGRTKQYKEHRKKLESARLRREKKKQVTEASGDKEAYQKFFNATLKKFGVKSPAELKDEDKKKFYDAIDAGWKGDNEKKEEVDLDEVKKISIEFDFSDAGKKAQMQKVIDFFKKNHPNFKLEPKDNILKVDGGGKSLKRISKDIYNNFYVKKVMHEEVELDEMFGISSNSNHRAKTMKMLDGMGIKYKKDGRNGLIILGVAPKDQKGILDKIHKDIGMTTYRIMDEEVELDEKVEYVEYKFKNKNDAMKAKAYFDGIQLMSFDVNDDGASQGELAVDAGKKDMSKFHKEIMKKFRPKVLTQEKVQVKEGRMKELHMLIKQGKTAEEIAKIMRVDAKTIKKLMASYEQKESIDWTKASNREWGTDSLRKHTEEVTPGQNGEWANAQKSKNDSMREALAKVWQTDEGKNPFKKESKKDLTKEVKDGKTMTGKKVASVDINPTIKEKKK